MPAILRYEKYIFWLLVLLHLVPVLSFKLFPTLDGPSHLYNSNLINGVISGNAHTKEFFELNGSPDPNYTGHIILSLFNSVFPSWLAEKLLLALIIITLPLSFRMMLRIISKDTLFADYLVFPFIYTFTFYLGFYNFTIGVVLMLFTITYWLCAQHSLTVKKIIILAILFLLLYFSHLFTFLLTGFSIGFLIVWKMFAKNAEGYSIAKQLKTLLLASIPGIALTVYFLLQKGDDVEAQYLTKSELLDWLISIRPLITLSTETGEQYTKYIFYAFVLLLIAAIYSRWKYYGEQKKIVSACDSWLVLCFIMLALYFTLPDWMASGGYISVRILLFFFLFLITWIGLQRMYIYIRLGAAIVFLGVSGLFLKYHYSESKLLSNDALELYSAAAHIEENSTVLPLNYSANWLHSNFSNYLGSEKKGVVVLDNYEAAKPQFPLKWKARKAPYDIIGPEFGNTSHPCISIASYEHVSGSRIDYVFRWYYNSETKDTCDLIAKAQLQNDFELIYTSPGRKAELFKRKAL